MKSIILPLLMILIPEFLMGQADLIEQLDRIKNRPKKIKIPNQIDIEDQGGHLQGVQLYNYENKPFFYFSGSSQSYGYLAVADPSEVVRLHIVGQLPLKHAGGFQIRDPWLAVGVEDNESRDRSIVKVYHLDNPMAIDLDPAGIIERNGDWERATAGAVALHEKNDTLQVLVGDWSNKHIDFYCTPLKGAQKTLQFEKTGEIDMISYPKSNWIEKTAFPYQNVNLIRYRDKLYMFGFSSGPRDKNIMDVFLLEDLTAPIPKLQKIYNRTFGRSRKTRFGWGAGISFSKEKGFTLYACGENILDQTIIAAYYSKE